MSENIIMNFDRQSVLNEFFKQEPIADPNLTFFVNNQVMSYEEVLREEYDITEYVAIVDPIYYNDPLYHPFSYDLEFKRVRPIVRMKPQEFDEVLRRAIRLRRGAPEVSDLLNKFSNEQDAIMAMLENEEDDDDVYVDELDETVVPTKDNDGDKVYNYQIGSDGNIVEKNGPNYIVQVCTGNSFVSLQKQKYNALSFGRYRFRSKIKRSRRSGMTYPFEHVDNYINIGVADPVIYHLTPYMEYFHREIDHVLEDNFEVIRSFPIVRYLSTPRKQRIKIYYITIGRHGNGLISMQGNVDDVEGDEICLKSSIPCDIEPSPYEVKMAAMCQIVEKYVLVYDLEWNTHDIYKKKNVLKLNFLQNLDLLMLGYTRFDRPLIAVSTDLFAMSYYVYSLEHFRLLLMRYYERMDENMVVSTGTVFKFKRKYFVYIGPKMSMKRLILDVHSNQIIPPQDLDLDE